jgi:uncharacterized protein GlcG (DUF336 family)
MPVSLHDAQSLIGHALATARQANMKPLSIVVLDERGALKAMVSEDGTSLKRADIAHGKAYGAISLGVGSRALNKMALERPHFMAAATHAVGGSLIPVPGGVLMRDEKGTLLGAIGISGDTSDNDELAAVSAITSLGWQSETGA